MTTKFTRAAAVSFCGLIAAGSAAADQSFSIVQDMPALTHVDVGGQGSSHGDIMAFEAPFIAEDGTTGEMHGIIITVAIPLGDSGTYLDRMAQIVVDFGQTDTLVIGGSAAYPNAEAEMTPDAPVLRAVLGGTGRFMGARGEVLTTRRDAGHYEHRFTLVD